MQLQQTKPLRKAQQPTPRLTFLPLLSEDAPAAAAWVTGGPANPQISGLVKFYPTPYGGALVEAEFFGLPNLSTPGSADYYALHIHEFGDCSDSFRHTGDHYNPASRPHPFHAGDLPPLLSNQSYAWTAFYDKRFSINDIIGRSVVLHTHRDDFTSQPSGDSGTKIGCGVIRAI